uniref:Uncharacterized protein n=1 Tax=Candidatus Kentrum eta TaxID=2126337 RepID=A0A450VDI2_9GAMM|nr:MAG: hypothetical protein BECKH772A_GA0070896_101041 [Candidatus Kentron sp. H]VFJ97488.1 MAG: hypothetical protein BECKH772B_GA0070898_101131 [Candidatus Kentron sp. H]VFK02811.1 MAG: hypothetical protein BECKH772C_GA0070978_101041 [Candidatus Kentron sp. H]
MKTDKAIALFSDEGARETILMAPYETYVARFNQAVGALLVVCP